MSSSRQNVLNAPAVRTQPRVLRLLGTSSTLLKVILKRASSDLGIKLEARVLDGGDAHRLGVTAPQSFDLYDQWFHNVEFVWTARSIQPIDTDRITHWASVGDIAKIGRVDVSRPVAPGGAPNRLLYVQSDGELGPQPSRFVSMLPLTHYADSFGYVANDLPAGYRPESASWSWLIDPNIGMAALQNNPSIGAIDAVLAVQAEGRMTFADPGNLTIEEIDRLIDELMRLRINGHFAGFWGTAEDLARIIQRRRVKAFSLWSPTKLLPEVSSVRIRAAVPIEGYRGWFGGIAISRYCSGSTLDMAYEYLNWWLDGWASTPIARQGDYFAAPERARLHMDPDEWAYWYEGRPASRTLPSNYAQPAAFPGDLLEGGSYHERMSRIAVWNAVMDEHNYLARRWNELVRKRR